jgi:hypothetical protein
MGSAIILATTPVQRQLVAVEKSLAKHLFSYFDSPPDQSQLRMVIYRSYIEKDDGNMVENMVCTRPLGQPQGDTQG